jgi:hypothetical protein
MRLATFLPALTAVLAAGAVASALLATSLTANALVGLPRAALGASQMTRVAVDSEPDARGIENRHPSEYYRLAARLFWAGRKNEAVFWLYAGQLRYRAYLAAQPALAPDGAPALFSSLSETVGRPIDEYAFGDIPALCETLDRVIAWDAAHVDPFAPRDAARAAIVEDCAR